MPTISYSTDAQRPSGAIPVLPSPAQERLEHLDGLADSAAAQGDARSLTYLQLVEAQQDAKGDLASYLTRCRHENSKPHADSVAEMQSRLDRAEKALRLHTEAAPYVDAGAVGRLRKDALIEARRQGADAKPWRGSVRKGATVQTLRGVLADLKTERTAIEAAPPPLDAELDRLLGEVDKAAEHGRPRAGIVTEDAYDNRGVRGRVKMRTAGRITWPTTILDAVRPHGSEPLTIIDAASMIAWLFGDEIKRALRAELEQSYKQFDGAVLTEAEKRIELKRIATEILQVEQEIAALAWPMILDGDHQAVRHLFDLQPKAVLGLGA